MGEAYNPFPKLPKNIRQIGERDQVVRLYVEDYVNTYLKRLFPAGGQDLRVGLLLGSTEEYEGVPYIFIDGAMEMEDVAAGGEKVEFSENSWKKAYQGMEQMFPKRTVQGWFLCGAAGCQLSPLNYWKQHSQYFNGKNKLMYLNSGLEGEESVYITSEDGFYKLRGHCIYYERNQMMQDYMVLRKDARRVETGVNDTAIRDFKERLSERRAQARSKRSTVGMLSGLCGGLSIIVLAGGIVMFNNYEKMQQMEAVMASVLPKDGTGWQDYKVDPSKANATEQQSETTAEELTTFTNDQMTLEGIPESESETAAETESETAAETREEAQAREEAAVASAREKKTYTVLEGETLYEISLKLYHSVNPIPEICELNQLESQDRIIAGQKLILP